MRALSCMLLAALLLSGCASVPLSGAAADADGKRFEAPPPGQAALYLYRSSLLGAETAFALSDNGQPVGSLADKTWIRVELAPGRHVIGCTGVNSPPPAQGTTIDLAPGEVRFVEVEVWPGPPLSPRCIATEVSADKGRAGVTSGQRAVASR